MLSVLKLQAKKFASQSRVLYVAEYEPGLYIALIRNIGVLEDGIACVDPDYPCNKKWLIPTDAEECGSSDIVAVWSPTSFLACAEGHCYASVLGVGDEFGPRDAVLKKVGEVQRELVEAALDISADEARTIYIPAVRVEECRGRAVELCSASCNVVVHLNCANVELGAYISRDGDLAVCAKCGGECPSECASVNIDALELARDYATLRARGVKAKVYYNRNTLAALISGYGALALLNGGEATFGLAEEVAAWLSDRGRQHIAELILREGGLVYNS